MRIMVDTNIIDRFASDPEAILEAENRRDLLLLITEVQMAQLAAIPDDARRRMLTDLASRLCRTISSLAPGRPEAPRTDSRVATSAGTPSAIDVPAGAGATTASMAGATKAAWATVDGGSAAPATGGRHAADSRIAAAAAARCDLLVTDDMGLLENAGRHGIPVTDWQGFLRSILYSRSGAVRHPRHKGGEPASKRR